MDNVENSIKVMIKPQPDYSLENLINILPNITEKSLKETLSKAIVIKSEKNSFEYNNKWTVFFTSGDIQREYVKLLVGWFCEIFSNKDTVKLIISTYYGDYSPENQHKCLKEIQQVLKVYPKHPEILLITERCDEKDILFLHSFNDCYINLSIGNFSNDAMIAHYCKRMVLSLCDTLEDFSYNIRHFITNKPFKEVSPEINFGMNSVSDDKIVNYKTDSNKIEVVSNNEFSGILYIGQYGTCGYATSTKGYLYDFFKRGIPISWIPLYFDDSKLSDDCQYNVIIKSLIDKKIENYDTVILHSTADIWPDLIKKYKDLVIDKKIIGVTVWETNIYPEKWVESANSCVNEIWCPSRYNSIALKSSGVTVPIKIIPYVFLKKDLLFKTHVKLKDSNNNDSELDGYYIFYNISELNDRKGIIELIETFCQTFTSSDKVKLVLKLHYKNYDIKNKMYCEDTIKKILNKYENRPNIHYILDNLSEQQMLSLHSIGNCYISLCRSEGFGLPIFDAYNYANDVIVTGYGGQIDYLGKNYPGLVKYELKPITDMKNWNADYNGVWAYPDLNHVKELMMNKYKKFGVMLNS